MTLKCLLLCIMYNDVIYKMCTPVYNDVVCKITLSIKIEINNDKSFKALYSLL